MGRQEIDWWMEVYAAEPGGVSYQFHLDFEFTNKLIELAFGRVLKSWRLIWSRLLRFVRKRFTCQVKLPLRWLMRYLRSSTCTREAAGGRDG